MAEKLVKPDFTIGDILAEFEREFGPPRTEIEPGDCYTSNELMEIYGISQYSIRMKLRRLKKEGRLVETRKRVEALGRPGVMFPVPAYQIKEKTDGQD